MMRVISCMLIVALFVPSAVYCEQGTPINRSPTYWYAYASKLPIGATVRVRTTDGKRQTAVLALVDQDGIALEARTRVPEPARRIPYDQLTQLELKQNGSNLAKAAAIGAGIGAGVFVLMLAALASSWD
jgi:hypothetical protein